MKTENDENIFLKEFEIYEWNKMIVKDVLIKNIKYEYECEMKDMNDYNVFKKMNEREWIELYE